MGTISFPRSDSDSDDGHPQLTEEAPTWRGYIVPKRNAHGRNRPPASQIRNLQRASPFASHHLLLDNSMMLCHKLRKLLTAFCDCAGEASRVAWRALLSPPSIPLLRLTGSISPRTLIGLKMAFLEGASGPHVVEPSTCRLRGRYLYMFY